MSSETCEANDHDSDAELVILHCLHCDVREREVGAAERKVSESLNTRLKLRVNLPELMESPALQLLHSFETRESLRLTNIVIFPLPLPCAMAPPITSTCSSLANGVFSTQIQHVQRSLIHVRVSTNERSLYENIPTIQAQSALTLAMQPHVETPQSFASLATIYVWKI